MIKSIIGIGLLILSVLAIIIFWQTFKDVLFHFPLLSTWTIPISVVISILIATVLLATTSNSFNYAVKTWLTTLVLSPLLATSATYMSQPDNLQMTKNDIVGSIVLELIFGFCYSVPFLIAFLFTVKFINKETMSMMRKKMLICLIGLGFTFIPILFMVGYVTLFGRQVNYNPYPIILGCYLLTAVISTIFYKLNPDK